MHMTAQLQQEKIVAILRGVAHERIVFAGQALYDGGIRFAEVTMNSDRAAAGIAKLRERCPGLHVGAGTVTNVARAKEAVAAGAAYLLSPNVDTQVIAYGLEHGVDVWPGAMTPTEIVTAWEAGAQAVKLFPAATLGLDYMKAVRAPLDDIPLLATGGIDLSNIAAFLKAGACAAGLGGQLVNLSWINAGQYHLLTDMAQRYVAEVKGEQA